VSNEIIWVYWACNVTTDLYLLSIPLPLLWGSRLQKWKKISLIFLFSGGVFVVVCATLRCVLIVTNPIDGAQLAGSWAVRETFVAVVTTNLPLAFTLVKGWLGPLVARVSTGRSSQKETKGTPRIIATFGGGRSWRGRGPPTANPITDFTLNGSEEHMVYEMNQMDGKSPIEGVQTKTAETERNIHKSVQVAIVREERQPALSGKNGSDKRVFEYPWAQVQTGHSAFVQGREMSFNRGSFRH
jgi:hypothetical protein